MTTLAEALTAADNAVTGKYGPGHAGVTRAAVEAVLDLIANGPAKPVSSSGWTGIRGDEPEPVVGELEAVIEAVIEDSRKHPERDQPRPLRANQDPQMAREQHALAVTILESFKARKTGGGWTSYANDKTMTEWRQQAGEQ